MQGTCWLLVKKLLSNRISGVGFSGKDKFQENISLIINLFNSGYIFKTL